MEWDEKKAGLALIAAMVISLVWMIVTDISGGNLIPLIAFSVSLSAIVVLFGDWFGKEE
jgi:hypothetical protein